MTGGNDGIAATACAEPANRAEPATETRLLIEVHGITGGEQRNIANDTAVVYDKLGDVSPNDAAAKPTRWCQAT